MSLYVEYVLQFGIDDIFLSVLCLLTLLLIGHQMLKNQNLRSNVIYPNRCYTNFPSKRCVDEIVFFLSIATKPANCQSYSPCKKMVIYVFSVGGIVIKLSVTAVCLFRMLPPLLWCL